MTEYLCATCGTMFPPSEETPAHCPICEDERQYIGFSGQAWTTLAEMRGKHANLIEPYEGGLTALRTQPPFAINQRAFLVETPRGNVLWDCIALLDGETESWIRSRGVLTAIAVSHPHYYTTMVEWSRRFGDVPVYLHSADRQHVVYSDARLRFWDGDTLALHDGLTLIRTGGHFEGGTVLHWPLGAEGRGVLLTGDIIFVVPDRRWVSFMYSYPNFIPLNAGKVRRIVSAVEPFAFDRIYGAFHPMQMLSGGKDAVRRSADRYIQAIAGE